MADLRKTVLITGCSPGGIGYSLAKEFHSKGLCVFATARSASTLSSLADLGIETLSLEVNQTDSIAEAKREITERTGGKLDFLVNNAGRNYTVPALDVEIEEVRQTFETNLFAVIRICQAFAPLLIAARGTIVQIGSVAGVMPFVFGSVYNATKAALHAYSNTLRVELAPFDVKVVTIVTGGVQSRIARTERTLPPDSYYIPISEDYERRVKYSQTSGAIPNEAYARSVVSKVLGRSPARYVWEGNLSWVVWFVSTFLPAWVLDYTFTNMFGLWKLRGTASTKKTA